MTINDITHPDYDKSIVAWAKFRLTYRGGVDFIEEYLQKFSSYEEATDFNIRKAMTYCPAFAKIALNEIKHNIFQHAVDIERSGIPTYFDSDVDLHKNSMNIFMGSKILPELLSIGKIGVYIDMPVISEEKLQTLRDTRNARPYLYTYGAEDIRSWVFDDNNKLIRLLLRDYSYVLDETTGLPKEKAISFRYLYITEAETVGCKFYDEDGNFVEEIELQLTQIPFVLFELPTSLLEDVADYQIALLNLESADLNYAHKSNFAFLVEQYDPRYTSVYQKPPGIEDEPNEAGVKEFKVGTSQGRFYPLGTNEPSFINPSIEPLMASMEKEKNLKEDIRNLVYLTLSNLSSSAESKEIDTKSFENGLNFIGFILEKGEQALTQVWNEYLGVEKEISIKYPCDYTLKSEEDRQREAEGKEKLLSKISSLVYKKEISKQIVAIILKGKIPSNKLQEIYDEIEAATVIVSDPGELSIDWTNGFVSTATASKIRGYGEEEVEKAKQERAERLALIKDAQSTTGEASGQARGDPDSQFNQPSSSDEKDGKVKRGEGK